MTPHRCPDDGCPICEQAIAAAEAARDFPAEGDWQAGQDAYERHLDRIGGSL